jgi:hypothetical protein
MSMETDPPRFELHARDRATVLEYFRNRAMQFLCDETDYTWSGLVTPLTHAGIEWGAETLLHDAEGNEYVSLYVYAGARGHGHLRRHWAARPPGRRYISTPGCGIHAVLVHVSGDPVLAATFTAVPEYRAIENQYGGRKARRSGAYLMNHIDEGLFVLRRRLGASEAACRAWCMHPIVQGDADLAQALRVGTLAGIATEVVILAMEYRNIANRFLSPMEEHPGYVDPRRIMLSPLREVNQMLIADKVQNYKDFILHHRATHPRADWLDRYFRAWLEALAVDPAEVGLLTDRATIPTGAIGAPREV